MCEHTQGRRIYDGIMAENFPKLMKDSKKDPRGSENPKQNKYKENTPRHIIVKLLKIKN